MKGAPESRGVSAPSTVLAAALASGALIAQHVAGKATRDTLFLSHFGIGLLPAAMIGAALASAVAMVVFARALSRYSPARVVPTTFAVSALLFVFEWWLSLRNERVATVTVYLHTAIFGSAGVSAFWSLVNESFDPREAKKNVGRIASGGTVGGVLGGVVVWRTSSHLSVSWMLALLAAVNLVGLAGASRMAQRARGHAPGSAREPAEGGIKVLSENPYLQNLALLVLIGAVSQALLDWLFSAHAAQDHPSRPDLLGFFALFNMVVGVASFIAQTGLARPILERAGLGGTVRVHPVAVAIAAGAGLFVPGSRVVTLLRGTEAVLRNSLYRSAYELFYTPLPNSKKRATKTLIDVGIDRVGTTVGSGALLLVASLHDLALATRIVLVATIALSVLAAIVSARLQDGYVAALASSLKSGDVLLEDSEAYDLTTKRTLAETTAFLDREKFLAEIEQFQKARESKAETQRRSSGKLAASTTPGATAQDPPARPDDPFVQRVTALRSGDAARIKADLAKNVGPDLAPLVVPLLGNDAVVRDAVRSLRRIAPRVTGMLVDALLDPTLPPAVRRRIPRVLKACRTMRCAEGLLLGLRDPIFEVRVQVGVALAQITQEASLQLDRNTVFDLVVHELTASRSSWEAKAEPGADDVPGTWRGLAHVFTVLGTVVPPEPLSIAFRTLRSEENALRGTALEYLEVSLPAKVTSVLLPLLGEVASMPTIAAPPERPERELADALLRSQVSPAPRVR